MHYRDSRSNCQCPGRIEVAGRMVDIVIRNVSTFGLRIDCPVRLEPGTFQTLIVDGLPIRGRVVWSEDSGAGIRIPSGLPKSTIQRLRTGYRSLTEPRW